MQIKVSFPMFGVGRKWSATTQFLPLSVCVFYIKTVNFCFQVDQQNYIFCIILVFSILCFFLLFKQSSRVSLLPSSIRVYNSSVFVYQNIRWSILYSVYNVYVCTCAFGSLVGILMQLDELSIRLSMVVLCDSERI